MGGTYYCIKLQKITIAILPLYTWNTPTPSQSNLCPTNFSVKQPQRGISHFLSPFWLSTINRERGRAGGPDDGRCVCRELPSPCFVVVTTHLLSHWPLPTNMKALKRKCEGKMKIKTPFKPWVPLKLGPVLNWWSDTLHFAWFSCLAPFNEIQEHHKSLMTQVAHELVFFDLGETGDCIQLSCFDWGV